MPPNLVNIGPETAKNDWRVFALGDTASIAAWTSYNRHRANFDTCYVVAHAYSLEQQNVGWAQDGLCYASSLLCNNGQETVKSFYWDLCVV